MADTVVVTIDSLDAAGDGVARIGGLRLAIPFTIPGERVRVEIAGRRPHAAAGRLVEVLAPSAHRIAPRCRHFGTDADPGVGPCGGCAWQHIAYPEQLRLKTALVERLVRSAVPDAPPVGMMQPSTPVDDPWGYRHKVHFVFGPSTASGVPPSRASRTESSRLASGVSSRSQRRGLAATRDAGPGGRKDPASVMGHYVRGTRRVIPVRECPVHDPRGNALAFAFDDAFSRAGVGAAGTRRDAVLRAVAIRVGCNTDEMMATLVVTGDADRGLRAATRHAIEQTAALPTSLHVNLHPKDDGFIFGRQTRRITGAARLREVVNDVAFLVSPAAFFQTNVRAAGLLARLVLDAVPAGARVADLYAGAGLFALPLAKRGHTVTAIEESRDAVADGEISRQLNRIPPERCRFVAKRVETALREIGPAEVVVLDPPREGCARAVLEHVFGRIRPGLAIYVSCNPEALARDLRLIARAGYTIRSIQPVDMFPHTAHIETVVVVAR